MELYDKFLWRLGSILLATIMVFVGTPAPSARAAGSLSERVTEFLSKQPGRYSVTALEIGGEARELHVRDTTQVDPASIFKLYHAGLAFEKIQLGHWTPTTKLASKYSVQTCLRLMISYSDNECAVDIRSKLGIPYVNSRLKAWGLTSSHIVFNSRGEYLTKHTTTKDVAHFLKQLHGGTLLNPGMTSNFQTLLKGQVWRARISSGLEAGVPVASKSGQLLTNDGMVEGDSAIIFGPKSTYLLVVIGTSGATGSAVRGVSAMVYEDWQGPIAVRASYPKAQLVAVGKTYLRTRPGGPIIKTIAAGSSVRLEWSLRGWLYVVHGSNKGFVYVNSVRLSNRYLQWGEL